ncbi:MAG: DUF2058 family protein [Candidatus Eiseniibacteriota bacterium]|jgi:uncharacterized protein YaiL (DUF2058 family)
MGSIRDQLIKAGLADKKRDRKVRHEEQQRRKEVGEETIVAEQRARQEALRAEQERRRTEDRRREEERRRQHDDTLVDRIPALIRSAAVRPNPSGNRRYYFVTRERAVSFIEVPPPVLRGLADGRHAIVETRGALRDHFCVVDAATARTLRELDADVVVLWRENGSESTRRRHAPAAGAPSRRRP